MLSFAAHLVYIAVQIDGELLLMCVCRPRTSEARAKSRAHNVDYIRTTTVGSVANDCSGHQDVVRRETCDDSKINTDSTGQQRQKPTTKRRLASFR